MKAFGLFLIAASLAGLLTVFTDLTTLAYVVAVAAIGYAVFTFAIPAFTGYIAKLKQVPTQPVEVCMNQQQNDGAPVDGIGRSHRLSALISFITLSTALGAGVGLFLGDAFFKDKAVVIVSLLTEGGAIIAFALSFLAVKKYFIIRNDTTGMFVTIDQLRSFLGRTQIHWYYGPGTHFCYPWERRVAENNISIKEATENLEFLIQLQDGTLKAVGSFRVTPDQSNPVRLLRGAAVVAKDIEDRIVAEATEFFDGMELKKAISSRKDLNNKLDKSIDKKDFQDRFGVIISDVTISQLLPSEEVQRTMSARSEAEAIANGTALLLGFGNKEEMNAAMQAKVVSAEDISRARDRFLAVSGNMEGMNLDRKEISLSLSGVDPEVVKALSQLMQMPGIQAAAAAYAANAGNKPQSNGHGKHGGNKPQNRGGKNQPTST